MSELALFWSINHWLIIDSAGDLSIYSAFPLSFLGDTLLWSLGPWYKFTIDFICPAESSNTCLSDFAGHHGLLPQLRLVGPDHPRNCSLINHPHQALPLLNRVKKAFCTMAENKIFEHRTYIWIDHTLGHKTNSDKFKRSDIILNVFSNHTAIKL